MKEYDISGIDVLIIEQYVNMRSLQRRVLRELGVTQTRDTDDPDEGFKMIKHSPADLIFCDWSPGLDGMKFLKRVRDGKNSPTPFVPIIIVSAFTEKQNICLARDLGMTEYLAKPISAAMIYSRILSVVDRGREFVVSDQFFGPDRRRRITQVKGPERRGEALIPVAADIIR